MAKKIRRVCERCKRRPAAMVLSHPAVVAAWRPPLEYICKSCAKDKA